MPTSATHRPTCSGVSWRLTPSVSTTSAEPHSEAPLSPDIERLPCLATLSPAPATTNAVAVETLKVPDASPPVPQVSTSISRSVPVSAATGHLDRKSTRLNSSHGSISYAVFCLKKKKKKGTRISTLHCRYRCR